MSTPTSFELVCQIGGSLTAWPQTVLKNEGEDAFIEEVLSYEVEPDEINGRLVYDEKTIQQYKGYYHHPSAIVIEKNDMVILGQEDSILLYRKKETK